MKQSHRNKRICLKFYVFPDTAQRILKDRPAFMSTSAYLARVIEDFLRTGNKPKIQKKQKSKL